MYYYNNNFFAKLTFLLFLFCLHALVTNAQEKKLQLTFSAEGKLLGGYLPRYNPNICKKGCKNDNSLSIRVLLPTTYFDKDKDAIDEKANEAYTAIIDPQSMLNQILKCGNDEKIKVKEIISDKEVKNWKIDDKNPVIPKELMEYVKFISFIKQADTANLNLNKYKPYAPFSLKIKGYLIDSSCIYFNTVNDKQEICDCIKDKKENYVALVFNIPPKFITTEITLDSFELIRKYKMKEVAIKWYNDMLKENKDSLGWLKSFEQQIRKQQSNVTPLLAEIDSLNTRAITCNDEVRLATLNEQINTRICSYKNIISEGFGDVSDNKKCFDKTFCSATLRKWILKLIWLNGDKIQLNPFKFTTNSSFELRQSDVNKKVDALKREQDNALIQLDFWETAIAHLKDSVQRVKTVSIDDNKKMLTQLILQRDTAIATLAKKTPTAVADEANSNTTAKQQFLTTSQVNYLGWIVPYKATDNNKAYKVDKMWLRNYYYDQMPNPLRDKLHFTYPEDENITLLLHNVPPGTGISVTEALKPFVDSAAFTIAAGEFVKEAASLYSSLGGVAPLVKKLFEGVNKTPSNTKSIENIQVSYTETTKLKNTIVESRNTTLQNLNNTDDINNIVILNKNNASIWNLEFTDTFKFERSNDSIKNIIKANKTKLANGIKYKISRLVKKINLSTNSKTEFEQNFKDNGNKRKVNEIRVKYKNVDRLDTFNINTKNQFNEIVNKIFDNKEKKTESVCINSIESTYINFLQSLYSIASAPALIDTKMEAINSNTPFYHTDKYQLSNQEGSYRNDYKLIAITKKEGSAISQIKIDSSYIKVGKFHYLQAAAGIAYTPNAGFITSVDTTNGGFSINRDEDRFRLIVGLRWYPWGLYNLTEPTRNIFKDNRWLHRLSVVAATSIPKPFQNMYVGVGFDMIQGLNLSTGLHWQQQNGYSIVNNQVKDRSIAYKPNFFYAITIDPNLFVTAIKSLVK